jgi:hypothetical protein
MHIDGSFIGQKLVAKLKSIKSAEDQPVVIHKLRSVRLNFFDDGHTGDFGDGSVQEICDGMNPL